VSHYARYQIILVAREHALIEVETKNADPNYLMDELPKRMARKPAEFRLLAQVAHEGDSVNDPTAVWPIDRALVPLGTISLTKTVKD
jgi:catalase